MQRLLAFVRLTRPVNLIIIALTLYAMRYFIVAPLFIPKGLSLPSGPLDFAILVLSVVCIAAAGNIINDYFDIKTDVINKPNKVIVGLKLDRRVALAAHTVLTFTGIVLGAYYGWMHNSLRFVVLHVFVAISLWFYSTYFKRETPYGNLLIALLTALVPLTVSFFDVFPVLFHLPDSFTTYMEKGGVSIAFFFKIVLYFILGFAAFSFLGNLIRELYKDLADLEGDKTTHRKTIPIVWGENVALWLAAGYIVIWTTSLLWVEFRFLDTNFSMWYIILGLIAPVVLTGFMIFRNPKPSTYKRAATLMKVVLLLGLCFSYFLKEFIF